MKRMILILAVVLAVGAAAYAQSVPQLINYQGMLRQADGSLFDDGTYDILFRLYDDHDPESEESTLVWGETYHVMVVDGQFNVILGAAGGTPIGGAAVNNIAFAFTENNRYLGITVGTNAEILPRQQILSAPFALQAQQASFSTHALNRVPPGVILPFGGVGDIDNPLGYIPCDGSVVSRETYAALFAAIGTAWGEGDGSTTFNVPDLRGQFLRGTDAGTGRDPDSATRTSINPGGNTGNNVGSIQGEEFKQHNHDSDEANGKHEHYWQGNIRASGGVWDVRSRWGDGTQDRDRITEEGGGDHNHALEGGNETRPRNANVNYIIKY